MPKVRYDHLQPPEPLIMTLRKFVIACIAWLICFGCLLSGAFTAAGLAAYIFGGGEYGALAVIQSKTGLAFWVFMALLIPFMVIGAAGGLAAIVLPAYCIFRIPLRRKGQPIKWLQTYLKAVSKMLEDEW